MPIITSAISHIRITVTDIDRSRGFYDEIFGWPVAFETPPDADEHKGEEGKYEKYFSPAAGAGD